VARDRKRAKQRRDRRSAAAVARGATLRNGSAPMPGETVRSDVPGALDHASSDVDEFDAALIAGASGVPTAPGETELSESEVEAENRAELAQPEAAELESAPDHAPTLDELQEQPAPSGPGGPGGPPQRGGGGGGGPGREGGEEASGAPLRAGNRVIGFLRASWAELQRVQWPDRRHVFQATAVVLGFVAIAGAYLGLADYVAKEIVEFIL